MSVEDYGLDVIENMIWRVLRLLRRQVPNTFRIGEASREYKTRSLVLLQPLYPLRLTFSRGNDPDTAIGAPSVRGAGAGVLLDS